MSDEAMTKTLYEKLLIQYMFKDDEVRNVLVPHLSPEVFMNHLNSQCVKSVMEFLEAHSHFPRMNELKLFIKETEIYDHLLEIMNIDTSEYDRDFILGELEEFYRKSLFANVIMDSSENIRNATDTLQNYPDKLREALAFTFNSSIGTSLLDDQEKIFDAMHDKDKVISTGIKYLDRLIEGGCHEKSLNLLMAATNVGKSLIMCALSKNFLAQNKKVLYISLEMSEEKIVERLLANIFDIALNDLKTMPKAEFMRRYELIRKFLKSDFKVVQYGAKTVSANKIRSILKDYQVKKNYTPDVLIVDYLGLMNTNNKSKDSNSYSEMKLISEELRAVAVEYGMPIWSAMQTNRNGFKNVELELTDIADSIGTAATADLIIGVTQNDELKEAGKFIWYILKNRYGLNDQKLFVGVDYPKMRIYGLESEEKEELVKPKNIVDDSSVQILRALESNKKSKIDNLSGVE